MYILEEHISSSNQILFCHTMIIRLKEEVFSGQRAKYAEASSNGLIDTRNMQRYILEPHISSSNKFVLCPTMINRLREGEGGV